MLPTVIDPQYRPPGDAAENSVIYQLRPLSSTNNSNVIQFQLPKMPDVCIDTSATRLCVEFQVVKEDNTPATVSPGKTLATINNQLDSMFSGLAVSINGEQILSTNNYHILAFFMKQLNYSSEYRKSVSRSGNYFESTAGTEGVFTGASAVALAKTIKGGRKEKVGGLLSHPFFQSSKLLPPDTELGLTLTQINSELFTIGDITDKVKLSILDCYLSVRLVKLEKNLQLALTDAMSKTPYIYPFKHTVIKTFTLAKDISTITLHNVFYGSIPSRIFAIQIPTAAHLGNISTSPFSYKHNSLSDYRFIYNGVSIPLEKSKFSMPEDGHLLFEHINNVLKINSHQITPSFLYEKFISDGFFLAESFISDCSTSQTSQPFVQGSVSVELVFSTALTANTTLLLVGEFSRSYLAIEKSGAVKLIEQ